MKLGIRFVVPLCDPLTGVVSPWRSLSSPQVYPNGSAVSFMVPPFAGTPIYPVTAGFRPVKMEGTDW